MASTIHYPAPNALLMDIDANTFGKLVQCLQKGDAWKVIATFLRIFDQNKILSLSATVCPAESLLNELGKKLCTIENLKIIFKECALHDALSLISPPERLKIISQPTSALEEDNEKLNISIGNILKLEFKVSGVPPPRFQWFKDDEILVDQVESVLHYERFLPAMEGIYFCSASQEINNSSPSDVLNSDVIKVEALPLACAVLKKPDEFIYLCEGSPINLKVEVFGHPKPNFEWLHENSVLKDETQNVLSIRQAKKEHSGKYRCFASNRNSSVEIITNVIVYEQNTSTIHDEPVTNKVALLIANETYDHLNNNLTTPSNDVCALAKILQTFGFKIMCFQNLNLQEIEIAVELFASTVKVNSMAFFYYAGHGFEVSEKFLMPTDCPEVKSYKKSHALAESKILQRILNENPALFVFLLDMCLRLPDRSENPSIYQEAFTPFVYKPNRNLIRAYSTTSHFSSYEPEEGTNGIYANSLQKYLDKDLPILTILSKVNRDISSSHPQQMPSIYYNTYEDFYLSNPIKGFAEFGEDSIYAALDVKKEQTYINGASVVLSLYKNIIQNVVVVAISNADVINYVYDSEKVLIEELEDETSVILRIPNLQKLKENNVYIELNVNNQDFFISKHFQIVNIFKFLNQNNYSK